jgi:predicted Zn-dependent peptidase
MRRINPVVHLVCLALLFAFVGGGAIAFDFSTIESKISDFTLDNGMKFIIMEDHSAPVVSFVLLADVGGADDPKEYGGLAHVFEHMAFKGNDMIGTDDYGKERKLLDRLDGLYAEARSLEKKAFERGIDVDEIEAMLKKGEASYFYLSESYASKSNESIKSLIEKNKIDGKIAGDTVFFFCEDVPKVVESILGPKKEIGNLVMEEQIAYLTALFMGAQEECDRVVTDNEFSLIVDREGGVGLNAGTGYDQTKYYYSFPSNKIELWFALESKRYINPVLRQFYKEKEVIKEERRMGVESNPMGRLQEEFLSVAFKAHPYGSSLIGPMSDINNMDKETALKFFKKYYVASNMIVGIAGDVYPDEAKELAEEYFAPLPRVPEPPRVITKEAEQNAMRRVAVFDKSQPILAMGYHRTAFTHPDDAVYSAIADYLGQGRTSLLYKKMVKEKKMAVVSAAYEAFPGNKYSSLFVIFVVPAQGVTAEECEVEVLAEIEHLKNEPIPEEELEKIKARAKASFVNQLSSRNGMASQLVTYENSFGDWHELFKVLDKVNAVTAEDVTRVANECFNRKNLTVAYIETEEE